MYKDIFGLYEIMKKNIEISKRTSDEWITLYVRRISMITANTIFLLSIIAAAISLQIY